MARSLPGSSVNGALQARILAWGAVPSSMASSPPGDRNGVSCSYFTPMGFLTAEAPGKPQTHMLLLLSRFGRADSVQPHRWQPIRHPRPWDSPGKNPGVGCHFLLQCMKVKSESEVAQSCLTLSDPMDCSPPTRLLHPWDFPGKSTGVGCHCLLCQTHICVYKYTSLQFLCKKIKLLIF